MCVIHLISSCMHDEKDKKNTTHVPAAFSAYKATLSLYIYINFDAMFCLNASYMHTFWQIFRIIIHITFRWNQFGYVYDCVLNLTEISTQKE